MTRSLEIICAELAAWEPEMLALTQPTATGPRYTHAHTFGIKSDSKQEQYVERRERLALDLWVIAATASELSWWSTRLDGHPAQFIATRATWAAKHYPAWSLTVAKLAAIHRRWGEHLEKTKTDRTCPGCGSYYLHRHANGETLYCPSPECEWAGSISDYQNLTYWRARTHDLWITRADARAIYGIPAGRLRWHIHAGNLHPNSKGLLSTKELSGLPNCIDEASLSADK